MIVTDKFVFVHFPRTGGTFITDVIMRLFPSAREIGYHLPRFLLPNEYSHLPVLGGGAQSLGILCVLVLSCLA